MKHVFEFYGTPQVTFTGKPYDSACNKRPEWKGAHVEGLIVDVSENRPNEGDCLYIEGTLEAVKEMCEAVLEQLKWQEERWRREVELRTIAAVECHACGAWSELRTGHADGRGNLCNSDGTVMLGGRHVVIEGFTDVVYIDQVKRNDRFRIHAPIGDYEEGRVYVALDDVVRDAYGDASVKVSRDP